MNKEHIHIIAPLQKGCGTTNMPSAISLPTLSLCRSHTHSVYSNALTLHLFLIKFSLLGCVSFSQSEAICLSDVHGSHPACMYIRRISLALLLHPSSFCSWLEYFNEVDLICSQDRGHQRASHGACPVVRSKWARV